MQYSTRFISETEAAASSSLFDGEGWYWRKDAISGPFGPYKTEQAALEAMCRVCGIKFAKVGP